MVRVSLFASGIALVALTAGCGLFPDLGGLSGADGGQPQDATTDGFSPADSGPDVAVDSGLDSGNPSDSGSDGSTCTCTNLVSAYRFTDANNLGHDFFGNNNFTSVVGAPAQSSITPPGLSGNSIQLDGNSTVCIGAGFTFDSTADHTLCWWSQPAALANSTNQFAQYCGYDTWTASSGVDYLWRINNCNGATASNLQVANVYSIGNWTQICQTYTRSTLTRTVVLNGQTSKKYTITDPVPITELSTASWCIGSYGTGGYWTGLIYLPMWFDRVLSDTEIQQVYAKACCLP